MIAKLDGLKLEATDAPAKEDWEAVESGLGAYNDLHRERTKSQPLALFLRESDGTIKGGLLAYIRWHWLEVENLWIAGEYRGRGYGSQLLARAEEMARVNGCRRSRLDTAEFQAKPFYEKLGYTVFGTLDDYPPGSRIYYLQKDLTVGDETT